MSFPMEFLTAHGYHGNSLSLLLHQIPHAAALRSSVMDRFPARDLAPVCDALTGASTTGGVVRYNGRFHVDPDWESEGLPDVEVVCLVKVVYRSSFSSRDQVAIVQFSSHLDSTDGNGRLLLSIKTFIEMLDLRWQHEFFVNRFRFRAMRYALVLGGLRPFATCKKRDKTKWSPLDDGLPADLRRVVLSYLPDYAIVSVVISDLHLRHGSAARSRLVSPKYIAKYLVRAEAYSQTVDWLLEHFAVVFPMYVSGSSDFLSLARLLDSRSWNN